MKLVLSSKEILDYGRGGWEEIGYVEKMDIAGIHLLTGTVRESALVGIASLPEAEWKPVFAIRLRGKLYVVDGKHRCLVAWIRGEQTIAGKVKYIS